MRNQYSVRNLIITIVKFCDFSYYKICNVDNLMFVSYQTWIMLITKLPSSLFGLLESPLGPAKDSSLQAD